MQTVRIAASGIVLCDQQVLLVRYRGNDGSYLVGPGGGVESDESLLQALQREVREETGVTVEPSTLLFIEDLLTPKYRMLKFWFLCSVVRGSASLTASARAEEIIDVGWFKREQLAYETVFPAELKNADWNQFNNHWETRYLGPQSAAW